MCSVTAVYALTTTPTCLGPKKRYLGSGDAKEDTTNRVSGWVLTADPELFQRKLKHFDSIEGYVPDGSGLYQRAIADAFLGDPKRTLGGEPIGEEGSVVRAYVYHRPDCNKSKQIPSGDWLQRDR
ncbi:expressed unknown protein [Seminavis robusta]|uniref:Gamma-glutamylcyclotransferase AIG2-like domain-containing protein n=1 Tax=Seminavis robusta TaxID=568900 RepID=A0A9N8HHS6_9STRA|nr:expressed unknown protein [Seminavis robusta]|eukprot:Sro581_g170230.1 n/a (125) ;mRNA; r:10257-10711